MREFFDNLAARVEYSGDDPELQLEALAYAEACALHIHPFEDFNGRAVRVLVLELGRRFDFPLFRSWVELGTPESAEYKAALVAFDVSQSIEPLKQFWLKRRFS